MKKIYIFLLTLISCIGLCSCEFNFDFGSSTPTPEVTPTEKLPTEELPTEDKTEEQTPTVGETENSVPENVKVEIVQMNDIHGHIEQDSYGKNGISNAAYLVENIRKEQKEDNTLLVANGDMFQETAISRLSYGQVVLDCMNEMKVDFLGIGNHEFDWGLDKILNYFDGDKNNGEANFPLINSNIYYKNQLLLGENIYESKIIEKENVKIGVISLIGNVMGSINANMTIDYSFKAQSYDMTNIVTKLGTNLRQNGADIIVVNIHDGDSSGVSNYEPNNAIAKIKYNDGYMVDAVINGHTHTKQSGMISRSGGTPMAVIQSNGTLSTMGKIVLEFNTKERKVSHASLSHINVSSAGVNYVQEVEDIVDGYYNRDKDIIEEVYCKNVSELSRYKDNFIKYVSNLMMTATGADCAIGNFGGFRSKVPAGELNFDNVYNLNPFDNHIILCKVKGSDLNKFYNDNKSHNYVNTIDGNFVSDKVYTVAIIDYVYFSYYFRNYRTNEYTDTLLEVRDLMIDDFRLRESFNVNTDYNDILIEKKYN